MERRERQRPRRHGPAKRDFATTETPVERYDRAMLAAAIADAPPCAARSGAISRHARTCVPGSDWHKHSEMCDATRKRSAHYRALLELNPGVNEGVRYRLLAALLDRGRNDEAGVLLSEYPEDRQALWPYGRSGNSAPKIRSKHGKHRVIDPR